MLKLNVPNDDQEKKPSKRQKIKHIRSRKILNYQNKKINKLC